MGLFARLGCVAAVTAIGAVQAAPKKMGVEYKDVEVPIWVGEIHFENGSEQSLNGTDYFERFEQVKKKEIDDKIKGYERSLGKGEMSQDEFKQRVSEVESLYHSAFTKMSDSTIVPSAWYNHLMSQQMYPFFKDNAKDPYHKDLVNYLHKTNHSLKFDADFHIKSVNQFRNNNFVFAPALNDKDGMGYLKENRNGTYIKQIIQPVEEDRFDQLLDAIESYRQHQMDGMVPNQVVGVNVVLFNKENKQIYVVMHNEAASTYGFPQVFSSLPTGRCGDHNYWSTFFSELHEEVGLDSFDKISLRSVIPVPARDSGQTNLYFFVEIDKDDLPGFAPGEASNVNAVSFTDLNLPISILWENDRVKPASAIGLETKKSSPKISVFKDNEWHIQADDVFQEKRVEKGVIIIPRPDGLFDHSGADWVNIGNSSSLVSFEKNQLIKLMNYVDINLEQTLSGTEWEVDDLKAMAKDKNHPLRARFDTYQQKAVQKVMTGHSFKQFEQPAAVKTLQYLLNQN